MANALGHVTDGTITIEVALSRLQLTSVVGVCCSRKDVDDAFCELHPGVQGGSFIIPAPASSAAVYKHNQKFLLSCQLLALEQSLLGRKKLSRCLSHTKEYKQGVLVHA